MKVLNRSLPLIVAYMLLGGCGGSFESSDPKSLARSYEDMLGVPPPKEVAVVHARSTAVRDSEIKFIKFTTTPAVVAAILMKGFSLSSMSSFLSNSVGENTPAWWTPKEDGVSTAYRNLDWVQPKAKGAAYAYLAVNRDQSLAYLCVVINF